jgi:hypothetical protein
MNRWSNYSGGFAKGYQEQSDEGKTLAELVHLEGRRQRTRTHRYTIRKHLF